MSRKSARGCRTGATLVLSAVAAVAVLASTARKARATVLRPDKVVVVVLQDRASDVIGRHYAPNSNGNSGLVMPYLTSLAQSGLHYTNSHGVTHPSTPNALALYSGATQGISDNGRNHSFSTGENLAKRLFDAGFSFSGYSESLPGNGSQFQDDGPDPYEDLYTRNINPMAQFTNVGLLPNGNPRPNAHVNQTFNEFLAIGDYANLPTVSYVIPNNLHNAHGSNVAAPWAGSPDEVNNDVLRAACDDWLEANLAAYLAWAKQNNSLLIITQDEERYVGGSSDTITTIVHGDEDLFNPGVNDVNVNHYDLLRTITDMYGLSPLGNSAGDNGLFVDASGQLSPVPEPSAIALAPIAVMALLRRRRRGSRAPE